MGGLTVRVEAPTPADCDRNFLTYNPGSRGLLIRTGERDLTLVGVDYTANVEADTRTWDLRVERGYWDGEVWVKTGDPLPDTMTVDPATGSVSVTMPPDDLTDRDPPELQYVVRVYDAGAAQSSRLFLPLVTRETQFLKGEIRPVWVTTWGGSGNDRAWDVVVTSDALFVTGETSAGGEADVFVRRFDLDGWPVWERFWDGGTLDAGFVAVVEGGYLYVGGKAGSQFAREDGVLLKYSLDGRLIWQQVWGSERYEEVDGLAIQDGVLFASLWTGPILLGDPDVALLRYDLDGNLLGSTTWKGDWRNEANGHIYADATGVYVAGGFSEEPGHLDAYLAKFGTDDRYLWHRM